ncbi:hypothetical protein JCM10908_001656 [Rhodotorula pacifica]|uniref:anticodon-binding domain-containing protein n=1 Tax=Rhodotorula pacifica TaxID=1495444 RepID=UPI00317AD031
MTSRTASPALSAGGSAGGGGAANARKSQGPTSVSRSVANAASTAAAAAKTSSSSSTSSSPANPSSPALTPVPDLSKLLNLPLRVGVAASPAGSGDVAGPRTVEGSLFTYDSSFVVLASDPGANASSKGEDAASTAATAQRRTFTFLRTSQITSVAVLSATATDSSLPTPTTPLPPLPSTPTDLSARVDRAVAEDRRARARLAPAGAAPEAQGLYDALAKTLPVRWAGNSIVVLDEVVIESPYEAQNVKGAKGSAERVERVKKMVEGLRARLGLGTPTA